jgi:cytochrome c oxidase subunit 3
MERVIETAEQRKRIHPHKFAMWIAMASIIMMFAGLTSAYLVRQAQGNWVVYSLPRLFWYSTAVIMLSSVTIFFAVRAFKQRAIPKYRKLIGATFLLGVAFCVLQYMGFTELYANHIRVDGNPSESFLFIIAGLHMLHIIGGIIALLFVYFKAYRKRVKEYNSVGLEIVATYWHFVDVLWIYLFVFFIVNQ